MKLQSLAHQYKIQASGGYEKTRLVSNPRLKMKFLVLFLYLMLSFGFIELAHPNEEQPPSPYIRPIEDERKGGAHVKLMVKSGCILELKIPYLFGTDVSLQREKDLNILPVSVEVTKVVFHFIPTIPLIQLQDKDLPPPYVPPIEFGRKREAEDLLMVNYAKSLM